MRSTGAIVAGLLLALLASGCQDEADDGISVEATGAVDGLAWLDRNGNGVLEGLDGPAPGVTIQLLPPTGRQILYSAESNAAGEFIMPAVMVGDYRVAVDTPSVGDTLRIVRVDSANPTVAAGDTASILVAVSFPATTIDGLRAAPLDRQYFVEGDVISEWDTFGDGTLHIRDATGAIRALRVQVNDAALGDRVRLLGTTSLQAGRRVIKDVLVFPVETGVESPDPVTTTTGTAATADAGTLDADLVRVSDAVIQDTLRSSFNEVVFRVDDGSGPLDIVLDQNLPTFFLDFPPDSVLGVPLDATGILVPPASGARGTWVLKPRRNPDLLVISP